MLPATASRLGPDRGSMFPAQAADTPSEKIAMLKAQAVSVWVQPTCLTSIVWKKLHAYTVPKQTCSTVQKSAMAFLGMRIHRSSLYRALTGGGPDPSEPDERPET